MGSSRGRSLLKLVFVLRHVTALTAPPLMVLAIAMMISGYALAAPRVTREFFGIGYGEGVLVHSAPIIRCGFTVLALLHGWAGTLTLVLPRLVKAGRVMLAYFSLSAISAVMLYVLLPLLLIELTK